MDVRLGTVTGERVATNREGELPVRLLQVMITAEGDVQTVQLVGQAGEECNPPDGALVTILAAGDGMKLAVGSDDQQAPILGRGEKRIYSTDPTGDEVMAEVRLTNNGAVVVSNGAASFTMSPNGTFTFSGIGTQFDHPVSAPDFIFNEISAVEHTHSDPQGGQTGVPV